MLTYICSNCPEVEKLSLVDEEESISDEELARHGTNREDGNIPSPMSDDFELLVNKSYLSRLYKTKVSVKQISFTI